MDKDGKTKDFLLTRKRQRIRAQSFLIKAIENNGKPILINIDKSGANGCTVRVYYQRALATKFRINLRKCKYLNNIIEQNHRFIKWRIQQGLGFKEFESTSRTISGIEVVRLLKKNEMISQDMSTFRSFVSLAA